MGGGVGKDTSGRDSHGTGTVSVPTIYTYIYIYLDYTFIYMFSTTQHTGIVKTVAARLHNFQLKAC